MATAFSSLPLSADLLSVTDELGFTEATPVQVAAIPALVANKDVIGQSKTGSGKTMAFGLPLLEQLALESLELQALVLCPTRELASQVARELRKLGRKKPGLHVRTLSGGEPMRDQLGALERGVHIAIGTPGRVLDHLQRGSADLSRLRTLVLDEADRMLEMGFQSEIEAILSATPASRQTVFFSATFPASIEAMSRQHQKNAERITIEDGSAEAPIRQLALRAVKRQKLDALKWILSSMQYETALVFCNLKVNVAELTKRLRQAGASAGCLHGDMEQHERDEVLAQFRSQSVRILIATDVAARGIDVEDLDLVVNYALPTRAALYTHRIGRTGRAGKEGLAVSIMDRGEEARLADRGEASGLEVVDWGQAVSSAQLTRPSRMRLLRISGGRKQKLRPGDILGALTGEAGGLSGSEIGKIEIRDRIAYVAVVNKLSREAANSLRQGKIKGRRYAVSLVR